MTEEQAKKKICILLTCATIVIKPVVDLPKETVTKLTMCIASDCMMWQE